jgi:hypothetical protein
MCKWITLNHLKKEKKIKAKKEKGERESAIVRHLCVTRSCSTSAGSCTSLAGTQQLVGRCGIHSSKT